MSKNLDPVDLYKILELKDNKDEIQKYLRMKTEDILNDAIDFSKNPTNKEKRMEIFSWLFTNNIIEIRIAIPKHVEYADDYHDKFGIFIFPDGKMISFNGSMNESYTSHIKKSETIRVIKSWDNDGEKDKVLTDLNDFNDDWKGSDVLEVFELSEETKHKIKQIAPGEDPFDYPEIDENDDKSDEPINNDIYDEKEDPYLNPIKKYDFQNFYRTEFIKNKHGLLEMATGSGKTKTALSIVSELLNNKLINKIIIQMEGTRLLEQWYKDEILPWKILRKQNEPLRILRQTHKFSSNDSENNEMDTFINAFKSKNRVDLLLIRKSNLPQLLSEISEFDLSKTIIIHDEVHDLFAEQTKNKIINLHKNYEYKLGLSATVEMEHEPERNKTLFEEIGEIIQPPFRLNEGIRRNILCEMNFSPLDYSLTPEEKSKIQNLIRQKEEKKKNNEWNIHEDKIHRQRLSRIRKLAEYKIPSFINFITTNRQILDRCIIFVHEREYGTKLYQELNKISGDIKEFYEDDQIETLNMFSEKQINTLITCKSLSQGISINSLTNIVIFASDSRLVNIQRVGRVLRKDDNNVNKIATIVDFFDKEKVEIPTHNEHVRYKWLYELSNIKTSEEYAN